MARTLTTTFATEKDAKFNRPFLSAVFHFGGSVGDVYVADTDITIAGNFHRGIVQRWGEFRSTGSRDGAFQLASLRCEMTNFPLFGSKRFTDLWAGLGVEGVEVDVYQNFRLVSDPGQVEQDLLHCFVMRPGPYTVDTCSLELLSASEKYLDRKEISFAINRTEFPNADVDDVGKPAHQIVGTVKKVPAHAVVAGPDSVVRATMGTSDTTVPIWDDFYDAVPSSGTVIIGNEVITYGAKSGSAGSRVLSSITRGASSSPVESHLKDDVIIQVLTEYIYLVAGHIMKSIDKVYVRWQGKVIPLAAGQYSVNNNNTTLVAGKVLTTISFTSPPLVTSRGGGGSITDGIGISDTIGISQPNSTASQTDNGSDETITLTPGNNWANNAEVTANIGAPSQSLTATGNIAKQVSVNRVSGGVNGAYNVYVRRSATNVMVVSGLADVGARPVQIVDGAFWSLELVWKNESGNTLANPGSIVCNVSSKRATYPVSTAASKTGTVTKTGTVSLSASSSAEKVIGDEVLVDGQGYGDDGSGTYTGTVGALIEKPSDVLHLLARHIGGVSVNKIDVPSFVTARGDAPAAYKLAGVITDRSTNLKELLIALGMQSRVKIDWHVDKLTARFLKSSYAAPAKTITDKEVVEGSFKLMRGDAEEIINAVDLYYGRDWTQGRSQESFQAVTKRTDATSITKYGERKQVDRFLFDFVAESNGSMAGDLADFWLARLKDPARFAEFEAFLDQYELLVGDVRGLNYAVGVDGDRFDGLDGSQKFLAEEVGHVLGALAEGQARLMRIKLREVL